MSRVHCFVMGGLGGNALSTGIIFDLANRLMRTGGVSVRTGLFDEYDDMVREARHLPDSTHIIQIGHSLGASVAGEWARRTQRLIACIYGFDPADNVAANLSQYRNTPIPANVRKGVAWTITGIGLGGGEYSAENKDETITEKVVVPYSHTNLEESIEEHLRIVSLARRLAA